jgi:pimeloyl-ACP methyl ester carboxylesterase
MSTRYWSPMRFPFAALALSLFTFGHAHAAAPGEHEPLHKIESLTIPQCAAKPVVVFENGSNETFDTWDKVIGAVQPDATIFAYNRPGYGRSEATDGRRDGRTIVDELRATLRRQGLQPPYVLVGHSLGGLYAQLFARAYPGEVKGLVLVDSMYPGALKRPEDFPWYTRLGKRLFFSRAVSREIDAANETGAQILALPWSGQIPVERLVNQPKGPGAVGVDFGMFNGGPALMAMIDGLYPNAHTTVADSDHRMQVATPDVVVAAIRRVLPRATPPGC